MGLFPKDRLREFGIGWSQSESLITNVHHNYKTRVLEAPIQRLIRKVTAISHLQKFVLCPCPVEDGLFTPHSWPARPSPLPSGPAASRTSPTSPRRPSWWSQNRCSTTRSSFSGWGFSINFVGTNISAIWNVRKSEFLEQYGGHIMIHELRVYSASCSWRFDKFFLPNPELVSNSAQQSAKFLLKPLWIRSM